MGDVEDDPIFAGKESLILWCYPGHDREITVNFPEYDHNCFIPQGLEVRIRAELPATWQMDNRGTRLEIHPSGRFAGGVHEDDIAVVQRALELIGRTWHARPPREGTSR